MTDTLITPTANHLKMPFIPNSGQIEAIRKMNDFIRDEHMDDFLILTGPAGSGKTSLVMDLIQRLENQNTEYSIAAPTGRAAQIIGKKTKRPATTMHQLLFNAQFDENSMQILFLPKSNKPHEDIRVFIIDEASMVSDEIIGGNSMFVQHITLLKQLFSYVKSGNKRNKILFIGDRYQLPPVNSDFSPALSMVYLENTFNAKGSEYALTMAERQQEGSAVLNNARILLQAMQNQQTATDLTYRRSRSFSAGIRDFLGFFEMDNFNEAVMLAHANSQVNALNEWTRNFRFNYQNKSRVLMPGELMVANQNILLGDHFLLKGTSFLVHDLWKPEEFADLHFINARIGFTNLEGKEVEAKSKILLESVQSADGNIPFSAEKHLISEAFKRNKAFRASKRHTDDAFVNAIRARYGYALTCHKAQGGEWNNVFIHPGYRQENLRWLYTAVTRAIKGVHTWSSN